MIARSGTVRSAVCEHCLEDAGHKPGGEGLHSAELSAPSNRAQFILQVIGKYKAMPLGMEVPLQMKRVGRGDHFSVG